MTSGTLLVSAPVVVPLLAAGVSLLLSPKPVLQRILGTTVLFAVVVDAAVLVHRADVHGPVVSQVGGHRVPLGISLVGDRFSGLMLLVAVSVLLVVLVYAIGQGVSEARRWAVPSVFHPSYLVLTAGVALALLTGDLFNLFVALEVMLMASYALITLGATRERVRGGMTYIVTSLLSSMLLLSSIGLVYGVTGTLNLAGLSARIADLPAGVRAWLSVTLLVALAIKAAIIPMHWWLPESYPPAPAPITAIFAALLTKVAVYAIIRTQSLLFPREEPWWLLLVLAIVTMIGGAMAALAQQNLHRILSFLLVSHIGFMLLGLSLSSTAGTAGAVIYLVHHILVQASLFLAVGLVERDRGTASVARLGGVSVSAPLVAVLFLVPALSLGGIPPLSGFVGKLAVLRAAVETPNAWALVAAVAALVASLLTLAVMGRVWSRAFWGEPAPAVPDREPRDRLELGTSSAMTSATACVVLLGVLVAGAAGPLSAVAERIGEDMRGAGEYREAVLGGADR